MGTGGVPPWFLAIDLLSASALMWRWASKYRRKAIHVCLAVCLLPNTSSSLNNSASSGRRIESVLSYGKEKEGSVLCYFVETQRLVRCSPGRTRGRYITFCSMHKQAKTKKKKQRKNPFLDFKVLRLWCIDHSTISDLLPARSSVFKILPILNFQHHC